MSEDLKVVIGAGEYNKGEDWIHTQEEDLSFLKEEDWNKRFSHGSISAILSEHVWEHLTYEEGEFHYNRWDEKMGFIYRSKRFDHRNIGEKLASVSLIVDAVKLKS